MLIIIKIVFHILQNKNQLKLLVLQMWMVKNNQKHLKKELQFYLMKSLFKKNKKKLQKNTSAKIDAKSLNDAGVAKRNEKNKI